MVRQTDYSNAAGYYRFAGNYLGSKAGFNNRNRHCPRRFFDFSASMLEFIGGSGKVLGIDIDIRQYNREEIEQHPLAKRIEMIEGSSVSEETAQMV